MRRVPRSRVRSVADRARRLLPTASAARALRDQTERLHRIIEIQRDIAATDRDLTSLMAAMCECTQDLTQADGSAVIVIDGDAFVHRAATGFLSDAVGLRIPVEGSFPGWVHRHGRGDVVYDALSDSRVGPIGRARGIRSAVSVPLRHGDATVGQMQVQSRRPNSFSEDDLHSLELLAVVLSAAISRAAEAEARREQLVTLARFQTIFERAPIGIVRVDAEGRLVEANPAQEQMLGYTAAELAEMSFADYTHPDDVEHNVRLFGELMRGERDSYQLEKRSWRKDGELIWSQITSALERHEDGTPAFAVSMIEDITERKRAEEALRRQAEVNEHQALHDSLTGLANRTLFRDRIEQAVLAAQRENTTIAVLLLDLDRFKEINDSLGHHAGDLVLTELGRRLEGVVRASDTVARLGGDEFGLLLPKHCERVDIEHVVERILAALETPIMLHDLPLTVEASIGVSLYPEHASDVDELLQRADVAMYTAKAQNSSHAFYDNDADQYDPARLTLVGELRRAIEERELVLYYQPKAQLASGEVASVEALVRWNHPRRGLVPPDEFIPLAQQTSLIRPLTLYVVDEALRQCRAWQEEGLTVSIAVNLSMRNLLDLDFPEHVEELLERWQVGRSLLEFEITESTVLADPVRAKLVLEKLSAMGIRLSIDDFGTGYSSLAYLKRLPVDEIKIDRSFVMNMTSCEDDAAIVRSTIDLGRNLGLEVVAEGVETEEIWNSLETLGCTIAQGYYLSRPVPASELGDWLRRRAPRELRRAA
ncbi:MAG TPA: EAL domain-containing protein [Gaiellaceae bacterium]|jgi:diguanylate cyclase (GGDEF)-like protein/PAS domain S-box-containing protein